MKSGSTRTSDVAIHSFIFASNNNDDDDDMGRNTVTLGCFSVQSVLFQVSDFKILK